MSKRKFKSRNASSTKKSKSDECDIELLKNELSRLKEEVSELQLEKARESISNVNLGWMVAETWLKQSYKNGNHEATCELADYSLEHGDYTQAKELFEELEDNEGISNVHYHMGVDLYKKEKYKEAMKARGISKNKFGGKLKKSVDGVATRGLTRTTTKGFGKIG